MSDHDVMATEDEVMALFAAADPVGDVESARHDHVPEWTETEGRAQAFEAETALVGFTADGEEPSAHTGRRWLLAAVATLVLALVAGVIVVASRDDDTVPAEPPPTPDTGSDTTLAPDTSVVPDGEQDPESDAAATLIEFAPELVVGERYASLNLGVDIEFSVPRDDLVLAANRRGIILLLDGYDNGNYSPETGLSLDLRRWAGWSTREEATMSTPTASIDPYDVDGWIAANDIVLLSDEQREIGGKPARVFEVTVDPASEVQAPTGTAGGCFDGWEPCFHMGADASDDQQNRFDWVSGQRITRFYLLTIEGSEPLLISVGAAPGSTWFDEVESTFVETLVVGPDRQPAGQD